MLHVSAIPIQELVERIRTAVRASSLVDIGPLRDAYDAHAKEVNRRLRTAAQWLREGLVGEALHYVESYPDALSAAAALEMGIDLAHFLELVSQAGIEAPARIDEDVAAEISGAYATYQEIEPLVRKYRVANLLGGGSALRLAALQAIFDTDGVNPVWSDELQTALAVHIREISTDARHAEDRQDLAELERLQESLTRSPVRKHALAAGCSVEVAQRIARIQKQSDERELGDLARTIQTATDRQDADSLRGALSRLGAIRSRGLCVPTPDLEADARAAESWLAGHDRASTEEQKYRDACEQLTLLLDDNAPWATIERVLIVAQATDRPLPEHTERRVRVRAAEAAASRRFRTRLIVISGIAAVMVVAAVVAIALEAFHRRSTIAEYQKQFAGAFDNNDIDSAAAVAQHLETEAASIRSSQSLVPWLARFRDAKAAADEADRRFEAELAVVKTLEGSEKSHVQRAERLKSLARTASQREALAGQVARLSSAWQQRLASADGSVAPQRDEIAATIRRAREAAGTDDHALVAALDPLARQLDDLLRTPELSAEGTTALSTVREAVGKDILAAKERIAREEDKARDLALIERSTGSLTECVGLLNRYVAAYPESPQAARFSEVLRNGDALVRAAAVIDTLKALCSTPQPSTPEEAAAFVAALQTIPLSFTPQLVDSDRDELVRYMKAREKALVDRSVFGLASLRDTFTRPWATQMKRVRDAAGMDHFSLNGELEQLGSGPQAGDMYRLSEIVGSSRDLAPGVSRGAVWLQFAISGDAKPSLQTDPMVAMAHAIVQTIAEAEDGRADVMGVHLRIADRILQSHDVPSPLRAELLRQVLAYQEGIGWPTHSSIGLALSRLKNAAVGSTPLSECVWYARGREGREAESQFRGVLEVIADVAKLEGDARAAVSRAQAALEPLTVIGVSWPREPSGAIGISRRGFHGDIFVIGVGPNGDAVLRRAGTVNDGEAVWDGDPPPLGTPLLSTR